ncbi:unnamed protein product [Rotaria sordida]|uniref:EF-hand domain-containing protein n=1 Tax=Rotaria sordida TaxID=392033 RepID=A0A814IRU3_9BILA|nr:unnamed protein product [Rotaria sordida]CAF1027355.1 unnamed protein product [Rotaria sordida]CAF3686406.1 unnamed protein product [Rotaria sordida]CAF3729294.1 unnamed protein product [Rotaria sordida]
MGARSSRPDINEWDWSEIEQMTGLSIQQIRDIQQECFQATENDGALNMDEFVNVYIRLYGEERQQDLQQQTVRAFETFDRDRSGTLSFDEFLNAIVIMNHDISRIDRIDYLIRQNNTYGRQQSDRRISSEYGHQIFRRLNDYYDLPPGTEHQCWKQIDLENLGYVTQEDIMDYISQQKAYNRHCHNLL